MSQCFKCNAPITIDDRSMRGECSQCGSDIHVCLNCTFYDEGRANKCREPQAEYVKEKDRANYCEYFKLKESKKPTSSKEHAEELWKKLFKKP